MNDRTEATPHERTTIHQRLSAVMEDVGAVGKGERNAQQGFNFRGVDAVVKAVAPALRKHGVHADRPGEVHRRSTTRNGGSMETVYLTVQYTLYGPAGDSVTGIVAAQANDTADKATAKAMSVAYRTFWLQALCIPTDEPDPDLSYTERGALSDRQAPRPLSRSGSLAGRELRGQHGRRSTRPRAPGHPERPDPRGGRQLLAAVAAHQS